MSITDPALDTELKNIFHNLLRLKWCFQSQEADTSRKSDKYLILQSNQTNWERKIKLRDTIKKTRGS